jgi:hypothetical protein
MAVVAARAVPPASIVVRLSACVLLLVGCRNSPVRQVEDARAPDPWEVKPSLVDAAVAYVGDALVACVDDADAERVLELMIPSMDVGQQLPAEPPALVEDLCWKRVYRYRGYRLALSRARGKLVSRSSEGPVASLECMDKTIARATALVPYAHEIIDRSRTKEGELWADPDLGVRPWIDCDDLSFATLLHELNHGLRDGSCLHDPAGDALCFEGLEGLPPRKIARVTDLRLTAREGGQAYENAQQLYLDTNGDESALLLLDELLAYSIDADATTAMVAAGDRMNKSLNLPLVAFVTMRYWELVQRDHADDFAHTIGPGTANRATLLRLLVRVESSFEAWRNVRSKRPPGLRGLSRGEDKVWTRYLATKRRVFGSVPDGRAASGGTL